MQTSEPKRIKGTYQAVSFIYVRAYREIAVSIKSLELNEETKIGKCYYTTAYGDVTPFGEVFKKVKNGDSCKKEGYRKFVFDEKEGWMPEGS